VQGDYALCIKASHISSSELPALPSVCECQVSSKAAITKIISAAMLQLYLHSKATTHDKGLGSTPKALAASTATAKLLIISSNNSCISCSYHLVLLVYTWCCRCCMPLPAVVTSPKVMAHLCHCQYTTRSVSAQQAGPGALSCSSCSSCNSKCM
jgi:hypothetical protein